MTRYMVDQGNKEKETMKGKNINIKWTFTASDKTPTQTGLKIKRG